MVVVARVRPARIEIDDDAVVVGTVAIDTVGRLSDRTGYLRDGVRRRLFALRPTVERIGPGPARAR